MGWISAVFVHKAIDAAAAAGAEEKHRLAWFKSADVSATLPIDPKHMIADTTFFALLERIADECPGSHLIPLRIGAAMRCDDYGAFGLAFKSAPDLFSSYRRVERFGKIVTSIANFRVVEREDAVLMQVIPGAGTRPGLAMTNELALAAATSLSREVSGGSFAATSVQVVRPASQGDPEFEAFFQCPVLYGSARDALTLKPADLYRPNKLGDAGLSAFFERHLDRELDEIGEPDRLVDDVLAQINDALSEGAPTVTYIAGRLGMSRRTLQRRLADAGWSFQDVVTQARQRLAQHLLRHTDYALAEVAFLTGFADQSTFSRAFRRWNGQSPASFRNAE